MSVLYILFPVDAIDFMTNIQPYPARILFVRRVCLPGRDAESVCMLVGQIEKINEEIRNPFENRISSFFMLFMQHATCCHRLSDNGTRSIAAAECLALRHKHLLFVAGKRIVHQSLIRLAGKQGYHRHDDKPRQHTKRPRIDG